MKIQDAVNLWPLMPARYIHLEIKFHNKIIELNKLIMFVESISNRFNFNIYFWLFKPLKNHSKKMIFLLRFCNFITTHLYFFRVISNQVKQK